jgi:predicted porin
MKKIVLATVLATAALAAAAQVTVSGRIATFVDSTKTGSTTVNSLVNDSSRVIIRAEENLGKGMTARVLVDTTIAADDPKTGSSTQLGDRQNTIGLASKFASIDLGRKEHSQYIVMKNADPFNGGGYGTIVSDVLNDRSKRIGDATFFGATVGPVTANYDRSMYTNPTTAEAISWSLGGKAGPVTATMARFETGADYTNVITLTGQVAGATLSTIQSEDKTGAVETKGQLYGVTVPVAKTPVTLRGSYGIKTGLAAGDVKAYNLGVNYAFSKRTSVLVAVREVNAGGTANDVKQYGVGLVHSF